VVVTATVNGHLSKVYQAMGYGALDAVDTPSLGLGGELSGAEPLLRKIDVIGRLVGRSPEPTSALSPAPASTSTGDILGCSQSRLNTGLRPGESGTGAGPAVVRPKLEPLIVLGASTGGPHAVAEVLAGLPESILAKAGVVVVQHVDSNFAAGLGTWLGERVARRVELIEEGRRPAAGSVLLSVTNDHLLLGADRALHYSGEPSSVCYRPSVDVFFSSVARSWPRPGVAVLLTGMGRDGAEGLLTLRRAGWRTIAQDQASSVVWGMPRAAIELGAAELVLPLPRIAETIAGWVLSLLK
jgi:two-component system response regulator WspF